MVVFFSGLEEICLTFLVPEPEACSPDIHDDANLFPRKLWRGGGIGEEFSS